VNNDHQKAIEGCRMKYEIVSSDDLSDLIEEVNEKIEDGWVLKSGICVNT
jgi:hypothetical protein